MHIRSASKEDLDAVNAIVETAVMGWRLPERVKRLALPGYYYNELDLQHFTIVVAADAEKIVGVAAWDTEPHPGPGDRTGLLLHGIYVHPEHQHRGIGRKLFATAEDAARTLKRDGIQVRAQKDAQGFFNSQGLRPMQAQDPDRDYANRYWKDLD